MKPIAGTSVFLNSTFVQFFARQRPASSVAKPRCIRKTSMPPISTQTLLIVKIASCAGVSTAAGTAASSAPNAIPAAASTGIDNSFNSFMIDILLPSPMCPVRAPAMMPSTVGCTNSSFTAIASRTFLSRFTSEIAPR